ncbi:MAG TPA: hypothetical protein VJZ00_11640, partial [Thermoanaerobaculia bacterium]|nr:hypothetical protein [Thermoanaerobaculia bacterium]
PLDDAPELIIDAPPRTESPVTRVQRSAAAAATNAQVAAPSNVVAEEVACAPSGETPRASAAPAHPLATEERPAIARLFAPQTETHVVRMPRTLRESVAQPREPEPSAPGERAPASILAAHEALVHATDAHERVEEERKDAREPQIFEVAEVETATAATPAPIDRTRIAKPVANSVANNASVRSIAPRVEAARALPDVASARDAQHSRRRVTIGKLELQVHQVAPALPPPVIRPPRVPVAPANALEGHFLDGLRWKL